MTQSDHRASATAGLPGKPWRFVYASSLGTSHAETGTPCQDAALARVAASPDGDVLIVACADGAGSASHSHYGAPWACETVVGEISDFLESGRRVADITRGLAEEWILQVQRCLVERAEEHEVGPRQLACTLLVAVLGQQASAFMQIGDGAIVIAPAVPPAESSKGSLAGGGDGPPAGGGDGSQAGDGRRLPAPTEYRPVFWPQSGEYANTTYFVTEPEALTHLAFDGQQGRIEEVAVFTDGVQSLALRYDDRTAHAPFFRPMFARLRSEASGQSDALTGLLEQFLASSAVNARTDDDKTLALATRRSPHAPTQAAGTPTPAGEAPEATVGSATITDGNGAATPPAG